MDWFIFALGIIVTSIVAVAVLLIASMEDSLPDAQKSSPRANTDG